MKLLTDLEIEKRLTDYPDWDYHENALYTEFEFDNFKNCMSARLYTWAWELDAMRL